MINSLVFPVISSLSSVSQNQQNLHQSNMYSPLLPAMAAPMASARAAKTAEDNFHKACEAVNQSITRVIDCLNSRADRLPDMIEAINEQGIAMLRIVDLAETMTRKSPRCATILRSPPGYFVNDFKHTCKDKVIPGLYLAVHALKKCDRVNADTNFKVSTMLEHVQEELRFALDSDE